MTDNVLVNANSALVDAIGQHLRDNPLLLKRTMHLKDDYVIEIQNLITNKNIFILIPKDENEWQNRDAIGLNLVFYGSHYV